MHLKNGNWTIKVSEPVLLMAPGFQSFYSEIEVSDTLAIPDGHALVKAKFRVPSDKATQNALFVGNTLNYRGMYQSALKWFQALQRVDITEDEAMEVQIITRNDGLNQAAIRVGCTPMIEFAYRVPSDIVFVAVSHLGVHNTEYGLRAELGAPPTLLDIIQREMLMYRSRFYRVPPDEQWQFKHGS